MKYFKSYDLKNLPILMNNIRIPTPSRYFLLDLFEEPASQQQTTAEKQNSDLQIRESTIRPNNRLKSSSSS